MCVSVALSHRINSVYLRFDVPSLEYYFFDLLSLAYKCVFPPNLLSTVIVITTTTITTNNNNVTLYIVCFGVRTSFIASPFPVWRTQEIIYNSDIFINLIQTRASTAIASPSPSTTTTTTIAGLLLISAIFLLLCYAIRCSLTT